MRDTIILAADLNKPPSLLPQLQNAPSNSNETNWVTFPDRHGNVALAGYALMACGVLKNKETGCLTSDVSDSDLDLDESAKRPETEYDKLFSLYDEHQTLIDLLKAAKNIREQEKYTLYLKKNIQFFKELLGKFDIANDKLSIRFLGDMLADRGANDYLMLLFLAFLQDKKIPFEIIFSNHDAIFMNTYLSEKLNGLSNIPIIPNATTSLEHLSYLISKKIIDETEVKALTEKCYSPNLKLISYDAHEENGVKKIKYYTHAPIDFDVIKDLTEKLHTKEFPVLYQDDNIENFCNTLDNINIAFKAKVTSGEIKKILDDEWAIAEKIILEINVKLNDHNKKNTASSILEEKIFDILEKLIKLSSPQASEEEINDKINSEQSLSDAYQCSNAADFINCLNAEIEKYKNASKYDATKDKNIEEIQSMLNDIKPFFDHPEKNENDKTKFESLKSTLEGSAYHLKQTPFHTILWSRIKTVSKNTAPEKIVTFANDSGEDYFFKTQYTSAQEGWKKEAINCHGHAGPAGSLIDIDVYPYSESKQYNNLDKSDLGKTHRYFDAQKKRWEVDEKNTGDLIQQLSINIREPKSRADNSVASSFARFNYGATSSDTTQNSPTLPAPIPKQSL